MVYTTSKGRLRGASEKKGKGGGEQWHERKLQGEAKGEVEGRYVICEYYGVKGIELLCEGGVIL